MADLSKIRNIGIAAHIDAGKTTTTERILFYTGRTHRMGQVDDGTTITDFDEQEQKRGITIYSAAVSCPWRDHTINLIDTPGHVDFTAEVERSLRVLDGMVAVFDAKEGVEAQSETVWRQADKYNVPRICFINKMDRMGADFEESVHSLRERLGVTPLVLQIPIGAADSFCGLVDLMEMTALYFKKDGLGSSIDKGEIPSEMSAQVQHLRTELVETVVDTSDELMEKYLQDGEVSKEDLRKAIRKATIDRILTPILCGSSLKYIGVQRTLDAVCDYLPSPLDVPPVVATDAKREDAELKLPCDPSGPLGALVFKMVAEKPLDLYYLRIYSGTLKRSSRLLNAVTGGKENVSQVYRMFAKRREELDSATAGDIVAVVGPKNALTGHTLCDQRKPMIFETIEFPETVLSVSIEPKSSRDRDKLLESLAALGRQDPTLSVKVDPETGQTLLSGMGELHLEVMVQRLLSDMNVPVSVSNPRVSYRETITVSAEAQGVFDRQFAGRNHFAQVRLQIAPRAHQSGKAHFDINRVLPEDALPKEFLDAIETGIMEASNSGVLGGYPVIDWNVSILSARMHETDSSDVAFENAARVAFCEAMTAASPTLLEPVMDVEVVTAEQYFGTIMTDLNARGATVRETRERGGDKVILADVPLAQMFGYITRLRSLSQGRATSTMTPSHYARISKDRIKEMVG